jgi:L(+)-tartrate dehydratase beta subunit
MAEQNSLKQVRINIPASPEDIASLELGNIVFLDGVVYTAREGAYKKVIDDGEPLPDGVTEVSNVNFHCSPAASRKPEGGYKIGGVTATASFRFSKWMARWLDLTGTKIIIGKGGMSREDYQTVLAPRGAIYLTTVGYGTGALLGRGVKAVRAAYWMEELGIAQAMWLFEVENFGPFIVDSDLAGNSLLADHGDTVNERLAGLYEGLKAPALHRFGETSDRRDEVL